MSDLKYKYHVSYAFQQDKEHTMGIGRMAYESDRPIFDASRVDDVSDYISKVNNFETVSIISWQEYELNVPLKGGSSE